METIPASTVARVLGMNGYVNKRFLVLAAIAVVLGMIVWQFSRNQEPVRDRATPGIATGKNHSAERDETGRKDDSEAPLVNERTRPSQAPPDRTYPKPKPEFPVAEAVQGKPGFVFSPFNKKVVDVRDLPAGTLVADPTYPIAEKKYFRVPEQAPAPKEQAEDGKEE